jgi:type I restriction enzyme S subunit
MSKSHKLSEVADLIMGQSPPSISYNHQGIGLPFYQGKADFGFIYPSPRIYCTLPSKTAEAGDILISVRAPVGSANICPSHSCIGRGIAAIRPHSIDREFLYFYLKYIEAYIDSLGHGAIFKAINKSQLADLPINNAGIPLQEQKDIGHILSTVQRAIELQDRAIQITRELKQALMQKLFREGVRGEAQKETEIGLVPESWGVVKLAMLVQIAHGYAFQGEFFVNDGPTVLTPGNFRLDGGLYWGKRTKFTTEKYEPNVVLHPGELVVVMTDLTPAAKLLGGPAFIPNGRTILHNQRIGKVVMKSNKTSLQFLYWVFVSESFKRYMRQTATGSTVRHTSPSKIYEYSFGLPSLDEQAMAIDSLAKVDAKLANVEAKKLAFQNLFRTLLHELMTAKIRVRDVALTAD